MKSRRRIEIAKEISEIIVQKYGNEVLLIGVYGSVARGEDVTYSDIDMYVITRSLTFQRYFVYKGIPVTIHFKTKRKVLKLIGNVTSTWPAEVYQYLCPKILYGSEALLEEFRQVLERIPEESFWKAASTALIELFENVGKVRNACIEKNLGRCIEAVWNVVWHADMFVALVNKKFFKKPGFRGLEEVMEFRKIPENYCELMKTLWISREFKELEKASMKLWGNCVKLAKEEGIKFKNYTSLEEIDL